MGEIVAGGLSNGTITGPDGAVWKIALPAGLVKFAAGAVFPVGLMLVVIAGSELFTGNCMFAPISLLNGEASAKGLFKNWTLVYIGNFLGSIFVAFFLAYKCGYFDSLPWAGWAARLRSTARSTVASRASRKRFRPIGTFCSPTLTFQMEARSRAIAPRPATST